MKILAIDTSCDETAAAVTDGVNVLSNTVWSQAALHAKWGGVFPSLAQRMHRERIDWVVNKAIVDSKINIDDLDAFAVTVGPGLAVALEVGIAKAKELSSKHHKPIIPVNHIEGHLLSVLAKRNKRINIRNPKRNAAAISDIPIVPCNFPVLGIVISGGTTALVLVQNIGQYKIIAATGDDALGEALDKGARALGFGYPGGAILEKMADEGNELVYPFPIPLIGREKELRFSYSGLKTALVRKITELKMQNLLNKNSLVNLAASYQDAAFNHIIRILVYYLTHTEIKINALFAGGGVISNLEIRKRLRLTAKKFQLPIFFPLNKRLCGDNAAMIGITAYLNIKDTKLIPENITIDRKPRFSVEDIR